MSNKYKGIPCGISRLSFQQYIEEKENQEKNKTKKQDKL